MAYRDTRGDELKLERDESRREAIALRRELEAVKAERDRLLTALLSTTATNPTIPPPTRKDRRMSGEESIGDELAFPAAPGSVGRMTYRQWLIGQALAGFCSISGIGGCRAKLAIESADEVLKQLEQERTLPNGP